MRERTKGTSLRGLTRRQRVCGAAAMLALVSALSPMHARAAAAVDVSSTVFDSAICQISLTITTTAPVAMSPPAALTAGTGYSITGSSGTCTMLGGGTQPFAMQGSGTTVGAATCANFVIVGGGATVTIGSAQYPTTVYFAGPTTASQWIMVITPIGPGQGGAGVAQLTLATASLQSCMQPGGTTSLNFSGPAAFAIL